MPAARITVLANADAMLPHPCYTENEGYAIRDQCARSVSRLRYTGVLVSSTTELRFRAVHVTNLLRVKQTWIDCRDGLHTGK